MASAILISSIARWRPGQTRGPAPNGIEIAVRRAAPCAALGAEPALGSKAARVGEVLLAQAVAAQDAPDQRVGGDPDVGDAGVAQRLQHEERRDRLQAHRLVGAGLEVVELGEVARWSSADGSPTRSSTSARARARHSGCANSSQIIQASVFAVVSSPASSIVSTLPCHLARRDARLPDRRRRRSSPRAGSSARRGAPGPRAGPRRAMKPCDRGVDRGDAALELAVGGRLPPAPGRHGANSAGTPPGRSCRGGCWMTSSSDSSVLTSAPKARPGDVSTVKRIRSACRSIAAPASAARPPAALQALADRHAATESRRAGGAGRSPPSPCGAAASRPRPRRRTRRAPSRSRRRSRASCLVRRKPSGRSRSSAPIASWSAIARMRRLPSWKRKNGPYSRAQRSTCWWMRARSTCSRLPTSGRPRGAGQVVDLAQRRGPAAVAVSVSMDMRHTRSISAWRRRHLVPHQPAVFALPVALLLGVALVVLGLALGERDLGLDAAALVVQVQRHEGEALLLDLADQAPDLFLVHQQLLGPVGLGLDMRRGAASGLMRQPISHSSPSRMTT